MPIMDGFQTAQEILKIYPPSYIIGCTGHNNEKIF